MVVDYDLFYRIFLARAQMWLIMSHSQVTVVLHVQLTHSLKGLHKDVSATGERRQLHALATHCRCRALLVDQSDVAVLDRVERTVVIFIVKLELLL